tara:strand:+ start:304 stop:990 length:687 start_codon:yes stop_codon:yes gene_type:complete
MKDLTLIIPAKKEKESLPKVLDELKQYNLKIMIILEKSDLETINSISNYNCKIIYQKNNGYGDALIHGINNVDTKYFCIFNADGSFDPKELQQMYDQVDNHNYDIIFGSRYEKNAGSEDDTMVTLIGNYIFTKLGRIFFNLNITDILYTYVLGLTKNVKKINLERKDFSFCVELPIKAKINHLKIGSINSMERKRIAGRKKVNAIRDGFLILKYMILIFITKKNYKIN